jgi:hypothetical protein
MFRLGGNDVEMHHQEQRRGATITLESRDDVAATWRGLEDRRLDAFAFENRGEIFRRARFVARRIRCVNADEVLQVPRGFVAE